MALVPARLPASVLQSASRAAAGTLFCFVVALPTDVDLLAELATRAAGCDHFRIYSNTTFRVGDFTSKPVVRGSMSVGKSDDALATAFNAGLFDQVWRHLGTDRDCLASTWVIKVDPDTAFFPSNLRSIIALQRPALQPSVEPLLLTKVAAPSDLTNYPQMASMWATKGILLGGLEVVSASAVAQLDMAACNATGNTSRMSEDGYLWWCAVNLGIRMLPLSTAIRDSMDIYSWRRERKRCHGGFAAFHPLKTVEKYRACVQEQDEWASRTSAASLTAERVSPRLAAPAAASDVHGGGGGDSDSDSHFDDVMAAAAADSGAGTAARVTVVSICVGETATWVDICKHARANQIKYTQLHGYGLRHHGAELLRTLQRPRNTSWLKLPVLAAALSTAGVEHGFWMDSDALFVRLATPLHHVFTPAGKHVAFGADPLCSVNAGHIVLRAGSWVREMLRAAWDLYDPPVEPAIWWEQSAIAYLLGGEASECRADVLCNGCTRLLTGSDACVGHNCSHRLAGRWATGTHVFGRDHMAQGRTAFNRYNRTGFIVHFSGEAAAEKLRLMSSFSAWALQPTALAQTRFVAPSTDCAEALAMEAATRAEQEAWCGLPS